MSKNIKNDIENSLTDYTALVSGGMAKIIIAAISVPLITRVLGPAGYGQLNLFYMVTSIGFMFSVSWVITPVIRFGKEEFLKTGKINEVFWSLNMLVLTGIILVTGLIIVFRSEIVNYISIDNGSIVVYVLGYYLFTAASGYFNKLLIATGKIKKSALLEVLPKLLFLAPLIFFFAADRGNIQALLILIVITQGISLLIAGKWIKIELIQPFKINTKLMKKMFFFASPFFFSTTAAYIINYVDLIVIKRYLPTSQVGVYSLAYNISNYIGQVIIASITVTSPIIISLYYEKRPELLKQYVKRFIPQGILIWSAVLCSILIALPFIMRVFFEQSFRGSIAPLQVLICGLLVNGIAAFYSGILVAHKIVKTIMLVSIAIAVVNLIGDLLLVPVFGISGAAFSSALAFAVGGTGYMYFGNRCLNLKAITPLIFLAPVFFVYFAVRKDFYLILPLVIGIYYLIIKRFKIFTPADKEILKYINIPPKLRDVIYKIYDFLSYV
ncbi:MAG: hypothetical protein CVU78_01190 [Elusimicrobia bacterium HGW-Elusimicrobia-2]|nr:MAG: hypothetical protein CVU78_01190 [Elusimicrobia bacterium HGW-Elusimicrobia-2]